MLCDLASGSRIVQEVERVLEEADVRGELPTPVDAIVAAAGLQRGSDDIFDEKTLARAPKELCDAVKGLTGKVRAMLDRREREVYVHAQIQIEGRRNFQTLHEVGHDVLPWQSALAFADDEFRLSWSTRIKFEQEANQAAAEFLFQRDLFTQMAADYAIGFAGVIELCDKIGASIHAGTRRYAETSGDVRTGRPISLRRGRAARPDRLPDCGRVVVSRSCRERCQVELRAVLEQLPHTRLDLVAAA
jgi:IrrE N-terminal-like domain